MNKRNELPLTEDLMTLKEFLVGEMKKQMEKCTPSYAVYVYMTHLVISRIAIFNKRRVSEVSELKKGLPGKNKRGGIGLELRNL